MGYVEAEKLLRQPNQSVSSDGDYSDFSRCRHFSGAHHSLFSADYPFGNRTDYLRRLLADSKIVHGTKGDFVMQIVVVKAPKALRGVLRMIFKMHK